MNHDHDPTDMTHKQMVLAGLGCALLALLLWVLFVLYSPVLTKLLERYQ